MSKPTFLTVSESLAFRNNEHRAKNWKAYLNGMCVNAATADTERGYVDVIYVLDRENSARQLRLHRLFGRVELKSTFDKFKADVLLNRNEQSSLSLWAGTAEGLL